MLNIQDLLKEKSLIDILRSAGRHKEYNKFKNIKSNDDLLNLPLIDFIGFCELLNIKPGEVLPTEYINLLPEIKTIKRHVNYFVKHLNQIKQEGKNPLGLVGSEALGNLGNHEKSIKDSPGSTFNCVIAYNKGKLDTIIENIRNLSYSSCPESTQVPEPALLPNREGSAQEVRKTSSRAQVPYVQEVHRNNPAQSESGRYQESPEEAKNIPVRTCSENIPACAGVGSTNRTHSTNSASENIPMRASEPISTGVTSNSTTGTKSANSATTENISTQNDFDQLSKLPGSITKSPNIGVFHNIEEANTIFKRQRDLEKLYREHPDKVPRRVVINARDGVTNYPTHYNRDCISIIEYKEDGDHGEYKVYYSVFNKRGDYLFSEVYSCQYVDGDTKDIKYYKKIFFDIVEPFMDFEFSEKDEIPKESFYFGIYRQYRCFDFLL